MRIKDFIFSLREKWMVISSLQTARRRLLRGMLISFAIFGFPAMIVGAIEAFAQGHSTTSLQYLGLYLPVFFAAAFPRYLSFLWQSLILLGVSYILALSNLLFYGFSGAGIHILLTISVLSTMILGWRAGLISIGVSLMAIIVAAYALTTGRVDFNPELINTSVSPIAWATAMIIFMMLSTTIVITAGLVQAFLQYALQDVQNQRKQLQKSEMQYRLLAETAHDLIVTHDLDGNITYANSMALRLSGYRQEQLYSKSLTDLISQEFQQEMIEHQEKLIKGGHHQLIVETKFVNKLGQTMLVEVNISSIREDQEIIGVLMIARDITERVKAEEEKQQMEVHLRQQQKLESIGTLASGVAHEINNPIMGIMNYAQLIHDRIDPEESRLREFSAGIIEETERVATIVNNLLTFARQEKQSHSPARIRDIVDNTLSLIRTIIKRDQIILDVDVPDDLPEFKCRSQQIQQVLMNLLTNARDALNARYPEYDPDKIITLKVNLFEQEGRRWLRTTIEDHGGGIPVEIRERIFDPFFTTKDRATGTGLGLYISLGIVKDHHGELTFESEEGQLTRFYLDLPVDNGWEIKK